MGCCKASCSLFSMQRSCNFPLQAGGPIRSCWISEFPASETLVKTSFFSFINDSISDRLLQPQERAIFTCTFRHSRRLPHPGFQVFGREAVGSAHGPALRLVSSYFLIRSLTKPVFWEKPSLAL